MLGHLLTLVLGILFGAVAALVIAPSAFSRRLRVGVGVSLLVVAVACLVDAVPNEAPRTSRPRTLILHHHYVTAEESAPRSALPIALAGILAFAGMIVLRRSEVGRDDPMDVGGLLVFASGIVAARFVVEKCAAGESVASAFGVLWLAPALGVRAALLGGRETIGARFLRLAALAALLRIPVIAATLLATHFDFGTHFSLIRIERFEIPFLEERVLCAPLDVRQWLFVVLLPQLVFWPFAMAAVATLVSRAFDRYQRWNAG